MLSKLLNGVIRFSLQQRVVVAVLAVFLVVYGGWQIAELPIDVFPSLDRPRVVVMTEAPGLAPEEVEALVTFPLESALNGATGVQAVRTSSGIGLSVIYVEFDWGTDVFDDRQIVAERLALVSASLPPGVTPQLAPISSVMGQIMIVGMWSDDGSTSPMKLRTLADWVVRQRLLTIPGVSQVFVTGGDRKQFQVLVDPGALLRYGVALDEAKTALTVAAMVGFISLCGIASRNGILLINHYLHLVEHEGESWSRAMIVRAGQERVAPVLMTALTSGIGLVPLALAASEPGKEILYPVATVIIGGLATSTLLEFLVRPVLFWRFGLGAAQRALERRRSTAALQEVEDAASGECTANLRWTGL